MKYLVVLGDGMADYPIEALNRKTPLQYAQTPNIDEFARSARIGLVSTIPGGYPPGSDVANLSVLGYDPRTCYTGRSPLEAVSMGVELGDDDLALRCNLVTLSGQPDYADRTMDDYSAGEISSAESAQLIESLEKELGSDAFKFYPGISYRHLVIWRGGRKRQVALTPPHDISDRRIGEYLPAGEDSAPLLDLMKRSAALLASHPVNEVRSQEGLHAANSIWFWGEGSKPALDTLTRRYQIQGSVICAVDLVRGLGICAGLTPIRVPGATGGIETNFFGKARAALDELKRGRDFVYLHIESPDECGHQGNLEKKIWSIEQIDSQVIGLIREEMNSLGDFRLLLLPDHPTPISLKTHSCEPVPFLVFDRQQPHTQAPDCFDETAAASGTFVPEGHLLMEYFIKGFPD
ncbi:MAG TPA: cofactor-independent phosphoglycerate mutase [Syntrophomonadaceae bacterium]|nr:cofactor-independent phosphoglycerate mutase [Syntrophomonadaceae bacterium]